MASITSLSLDRSYTLPLPALILVAPIVIAATILRASFRLASRPAIIFARILILDLN